MTIFETSKKILLKIICENIPFATALKSTFRNEKSDQNVRSNVTALVGCELRHHLVFDNLISRFFGSIDLEKSAYTRFYLANQLFLKRFVSKEILELARLDVDEKKLDELIEFISKTNEIIPPELDKSSPEFLSYRFNTPSWVIKMWQKQYGKGLVFKILKSNYHQSFPTLRVDTNAITSEELLSKHKELSPSEIKDIVIYNGKGNPKNFEEFLENKIFFMKMATKYVLDKLDIEPIKKIVVYSDVPNNIYLDLLIRLQKQLNLDLIINHTQSYFETKRNLEVLGVSNIALYNTSAANIITCVSAPVDLLICLPNSTAFDLLRSTPDYFNRAKQEKLDEILKSEKDALEECSKLINPNGELVYMIPTLNKKESLNLIGEFIAFHSEFELKEEKQFFPFESMDSCLYYAILKRKGESND